MELARRHILDFAILTEKLTTPKTFDINWHHREIADALEKVEKGEIKKLAIFLPPRSGKSILSSQVFPAWYLGKNPNKKVIVASYGQELATGFVRKTRDIIASEFYSPIFNTKLKADLARQDRFETTENGGMMAAGVGSSLTGFGASLIIIDDVHKDRQEAESKTMRDNVDDWFRSTCFTRLEPDGAIVMLLTRWHLDDLPARLLKKGGWTVLSFPAIAMTDEKHRKAGEPLWAERFSLERLEEIKAMVGVYDWNSLYQQNPIATENQEFREKDFRYKEHSELRHLDLEYYTAVDLAISQGKEADRTAIVTVGKERNKPEWYIVDIVAARLNPLETIDALFSVYERYRPVRIGIETIAYQQSLLYFLNEEMRRRQVYMPIEELRPTTKKELRIRGLVPMYRTGVIHHIKGKETSILEEELLTFPSGVHDDVVDALAMLIPMVNNTQRGTKIVYHE